MVTEDQEPFIVSRVAATTTVPSQCRFTPWLVPESWTVREVLYEGHRGVAKVTQRWVYQGQGGSQAATTVTEDQQYPCGCYAEIVYARDTFTLRALTTCGNAKTQACCAAGLWKSLPRACCGG